MFSDSIRNIPKYLPKSVRDRLKIIAPVYESVLRASRSSSNQVVQTRWGPKIIVDYAQYVERDLAYGDYESDFIEYFININDGSFKHFADIGANIGFYSVFFDYLTSDSAQIDAFEPVPANISRIEANLELNNCESVEIHRIALYDCKEKREMSVPDTSRGEATLSENSWTNRPIKKLQVTQSTLDLFYEDSIPRPDLIKIDIEGAEAGLLKGGKEILSAEQPDLLIEIHPSLIENLGYSVSELKQILIDTGYQQITHISDRSTEAIENVQLENIEDDERHLHIQA